MNKYNDDDVKELYSAFIKLCDFIEENDNIGCGNCPLWKTICGNKDQSVSNRFSKSLRNIRHNAGIPDPQ